DANSYRASRRRKLHRVADEIGECLRNSLTIRFDIRQVVGCAEPKSERLRLHNRCESSKRITQQFLRVLFLHVDCEASRFDARHIEKIPNQAIHLLGSLANNGNMFDQLCRDRHVTLTIEHHSGQHLYRIHRVTQIVRNDSDHVIARANSCVHLIVEARVVYCETGTTSKLLAEKKIVLVVASCFSVKAQHAERLPSGDERRDDRRAWKRVEYIV